MAVSCDRPPGGGVLRGGAWGGRLVFAFDGSGVGLCDADTHLLLSQFDLGILFESR